MSDPLIPTSSGSSSSSSSSSLSSASRSLVTMRRCRRCGKEFDPTDLKSKGEKVCQYHPLTYVCRFHPEGEKYYAAVEEVARHKGWEAKFWDCCGEEDPHGPGCKFHHEHQMISYDDDDAHK